jgi:hypothetical protein
MLSIPHTNPSRKRNKLIVIPPPRRTVIDGGAARRLLVNLAGLLMYAAESADSRELVAGLDLIRKAPALLSSLEIGQ